MANTTNIDLVKPAGTDHALISVINSNSDKIDAEAGRQRGNFAGTYSSTSGYAVGDYCIYQGNLYRCTTAIGSSGENWTAGHWTSVKVGTELKGLSDQIVNKIGFAETNLQGVAVTASDSGGYYAEVNIGSLIPSGAIPFSVSTTGGFTGGCSYNIGYTSGAWKLQIGASNSFTFTTIGSRDIRIYYYYP